MRTKLADLEADEQELTQEIAQRQKELAVIRQMIEIMQNLQAPKNEVRNVEKHQVGKPIALRKAIRMEFKKNGAGWISAGELSRRLHDSGLGTGKRWIIFRANVSSALRSLSERGELIRRNIGTSKSANYEYTVKDHAKTG